jgi:hypothetical protein
MGLSPEREAAIRKQAEQGFAQGPYTTLELLAEIERLRGELKAESDQPVSGAV